VRWQSLRKIKECLGVKGSCQASPAKWRPTVLTLILMNDDAVDFRPVGPGWLVEARWADTGLVESMHLIGWTRSKDGARWLPTGL
jgi:hypothetical protein